MTKIKTYINPPRSRWRELTARCTSDNSGIAAIVSGIIAEVRDGGDAALRAISERIDGYAPASFELDTGSRRDIAASVPQPLREAIMLAKGNIAKFHRAQIPSEVDIETMPGVRCVQRAVPISRVGLYIPGGKAPLFSTVLMLAVPAKLAGCREIVLCTPAGPGGRIAPEIILAAELCGVDHIFTIGGAQAIAAMALGTETVPKVDKIFGPGNRFVTTAKQMLGATDVAIDMPAGPSEVMVVADSSANPDFVAADFLSQAEHGDDSQAMLLCDSPGIAAAVENAVATQMSDLPRRDTVEKALANSRIIVLPSRDDMLAFANLYAPEHLILSIHDPWEAATAITAAGSVFIGNYSPESAGDYASGTNHTLPTSGWATACSGVNIDSFMHKITYQELTREGLRAIGATITAMARAEGLDAHANAVTVRLKGGES